MTFRLIDSHCHLQMPAYDADRAELINAMAEDGLAAIVVGTNALTSRQAVELAEQHANLWAAIAVHPGHAHEPHHDKDETAEPPVEEIFDPQFFSVLAKSAKVVAIGETGLDYYRLPENEALRKTIKSKQRECFVAQIRFAREHSLPLSLHVRDAHEDAWNILNEEGYFNGVMHCFTGTEKDAERYVSAGFYISFTGAITYPPRKNETENPLVSVAKIVPLDRLMVETDAPWLTPVPLRGERNIPANVRLAAQKIAEIKNTTFEGIAEKSVKNTIKLFNLATRT